MDQIFTAEEVGVIMRIPISIIGRKDELYWKEDGRGIYIVKSGYEVAKKMQTESKGQGRHQEAGSSRQEGRVWRKMWRLNIKHKLKNFMRSCLNQSLPVNALVNQRTRKGEPICNCCGESIETIEHVLLQCRRAKEIWKLALVQWDGLERRNHNFWEWWEHLMGASARKEGLKHIEITVYILWQIWKDRNRYKFEEEPKDRLAILNTAVQEW